MFLSAQVKNLRGDRTQKEFAKVLNTTQSIVSDRYENPEYGQLTLKTMLDIASKLDVALVVRFVSFPDFFKMTSDFSENAQIPKSYDHQGIQDLISPRPHFESALTESLRRGVQGQNQPVGISSALRSKRDDDLGLPNYKPYITGAVQDEAQQYPH
jgi:hypothetical protein